MSAARAGDVLPDVLTPGLRLVFCGMAAGTRSAEIGAYYAGPGNKFWPTVHRIGLLPRLAPVEFRRAMDHGIGLTDLAKRQSGGDAAIRIGERDRRVLREKIERFRPAILAFVGKGAACGFLECRTLDYGWQDRRIGECRLYVLPSPSGAANAFWDEAPWFALARFVRCGFSPD